MATVSGALKECEGMMKTTRSGVLRLLSTIALTLLIGGCGARTIVDESGKPLAGVHVVATYWGEGMYLAGTRVSCFRVEALVTGAEGSFDFPFFSGNFNPMVPKRTRDIGFFKAGYELVSNQTDFADPVRMRPFSGIAKQRFEPGLGDYAFYRRAYSCPNVGAKLQPYLGALQVEAKQIAKTYEDRLFVIELEYLLEEVRTNSADGVTEFDPAATERIRRDYESNLPAMQRADEKRKQLRKELGKSE